MMTPLVRSSLVLLVVVALSTTRLVQADCTAPPGIANASSPACHGLEKVGDGQKCVAACLEGFEATVPQLTCIADGSGKFIPQAFACRRPAKVMVHIEFLGIVDRTAFIIDPKAKEAMVKTVSSAVGNGIQDSVGIEVELSMHDELEKPNHESGRKVALVVGRRLLNTAHTVDVDLTIAVPNGRDCDAVVEMFMEYGTNHADKLYLKKLAEKNILANGFHVTNDFEIYEVTSYKEGEKPKEEPQSWKGKEEPDVREAMLAIVSLAVFLVGVASWVLHLTGMCPEKAGYAASAELTEMKMESQAARRRASTANRLGTDSVNAELFRAASDPHGTELSPM